jgi:hypothetical protein
MFLKRKSSVGFAGPSFLGHQMGKFCPKTGPPILQWVLIKAFPMISRIYNNQSTQKKGNQGKKRESPTSKETNELPKRMGPQGEHQVPKLPPVARSMSNKERGGPCERTLNKKIPQKEKLTSRTYPPK